jgi:hypothetical protein
VSLRPSVRSITRVLTLSGLAVAGMLTPGDGVQSKADAADQCPIVRRYFDETPISWGGTGQAVGEFGQSCACFEIEWGRTGPIYYDYNDCVGGG